MALLERPCRDRDRGRSALLLLFRRMAVREEGGGERLRSRSRSFCRDVPLCRPLSRLGLLLLVEVMGQLPLVPRGVDRPRRQLAEPSPDPSFATFQRKSVLVFSPDSPLSQLLQYGGGDVNQRLPTIPAAFGLSTTVPAPLLALHKSGFVKEEKGSISGAHPSLEPRCERRRRRGAGERERVLRI